MKAATQALSASPRLSGHNDKGHLWTDLPHFQHGDYHVKINKSVALGVAICPLGQIRLA